MAGLRNDTLRRLESRSTLINGYLQCGDWIHDYIQPYLDVICSRWHRIKHAEAWLQRWRHEGGVINGASEESILIRNIIRQVNPLITPTQHGTELVNVYNLMTIYEDRCRVCHKNVANMNEQTYYTFIKDAQEKAQIHTATVINLISFHIVPNKLPHLLLCRGSSGRIDMPLNMPKD